MLLYAFSYTNGPEDGSAIKYFQESDYYSIAKYLVENEYRNTVVFDAGEEPIIHMIGSKIDFINKKRIDEVELISCIKKIKEGVL